jgi:hypothetical protein
MKVRKPNLPKFLYTKFLTQAKKNIAWIFETIIVYILKLIMIINVFT